MSCDTVTIQIRLNEAEKAYHSLATGQQARVVVDQNGERVEYTAANMRSLFGYISQLRSSLQCGASVGVPAKPMGFLF